MAKPRPKTIPARALDFVLGVAWRFDADDCFRAASALSYTSVLSIVPLAAVVIALASVFPATAEMIGGMETYIYGNFLPDFGGEVVSQLRGFIGNAGRLGVLSALFLVVTSVMLLSTIEHSLNVIWRVARPRGQLQRLLIYWTMVTLGPLLFGVSLSLSGYAFALGQRVGIDPGRLPLGQLGEIVPWALEFIAFALMYTVIPNRSVRLTHSLIGALVASVAFEALKKGFGIYVQGAVDYRTIYGALAAVPLFLIWMYLSWATTLLGAEVAAFLPEWGARQRGIDGEIGAPRRRLALAVAVLALLARRARVGLPLNRRHLRASIPAAFSELDQLLEALQRGRFIMQDDERWSLARDLRYATLNELLGALDLGHEPLAAEPPPGAPAWAQRLYERTAKLSQAEREIAAISLADLLAD
jgi:membrane protein